MSASVLICDQLPLVRDGLRTLLDARPDIAVVGATDDTRQARVLARVHRPDVVLIGMTQLKSSLELVRMVSDDHHSLGSPPHCLVFYNELTHEVIAELLRAGVRGMLNRDADCDEVILAARTVAHGRTVLTPEVADHLIGWFRDCVTRPRATDVPEIRVLTDREREVLTLIGRGVSIDDVASSLYISVSTVRTHLHRIRHKLDLRDRAQLVAFAYRSGLMREAVA